MSSVWMIFAKITWRVFVLFSVFVNCTNCIISISDVTPWEGSNRLSCSSSELISLSSLPFSSRVCAFLSTACLWCVGTVRLVCSAYGLKFTTWLKWDADGWMADALWLFWCWCWGLSRPVLACELLVDEGWCSDSVIDFALVFDWPWKTTECKHDDPTCFYALEAFIPFIDRGDGSISIPFCVENWTWDICASGI
jgi:hypothetical protein